MPTISVIVPLYNVEQYLPRCVDSILAQTYADFELILVDDGSSDRSGAICEEYARRDSRICFIHQQNSGVSAARNTGLSIARGDYIAFIDSDDYVSPYYLEKLFGKDHDLSICNMAILRYGCKAPSDARNQCDQVCKVTPENMLQWYEEGKLYSACTCLFNHSIIRNHNLQFHTATTRGEDTIFMLEYVELCQSVRFLADSLYYYVRNGDVASYSCRLNEKNILALNYIDCYLKQWFSSHNLRSEKFEDIFYWTKNEQRLYFMTVMKSGDIPLKEKWHLYRVFFSLPNFSDNIPRFFCNHPIFCRLVSLRSPVVMCLCDLPMRLYARFHHDS